MRTGLYRDQQNRLCYIRAVATKKETGERLVLYDTETETNVLAPVDQFQHHVLLREVVHHNIPIQRLF